MYFKFYVTAQDNNEPLTTKFELVVQCRITINDLPFGMDLACDGHYHDVTI